MSIMPIVVYRAVVSALQAELAAPSRQPASQVLPTQRIDTLAPALADTQTPVERESVQLLRALGLMLEEATAASLPEKIVRAVIDVLKVDVAGLLRTQDANYADFVVVYDNVMQRSVNGMALNLTNQATLVNTIERRVQRPLFADRNGDELNDLYTRLDIDQSGPAYFQPLVHDGDLVAILMVALPYAARELYSGEIDMLKGIAVISAGLLAMSFAANDARMMAEEQALQAMISGAASRAPAPEPQIIEDEETRAELQVAREQIGELSRQVMQLKLQLDDERTRLAESMADSEGGMSISERVVAMSEEQETLRRERDEMARRLQEAEAALSGATAPDKASVVHKMIEALQREKDGLITERERLQNQLDDLRGDDGGVVLPEAVQTIVSQLADEKMRLATERDSFKGELNAIQDQLRVLGIETDETSGLASLISELYEQNAALQTDNNQLQTDVDRLQGERGRIEQALQMEEARAYRIQMLEAEIQNLASDREAVTKQRDKMRAVRDELLAKMETIKEHRARLLAQAAGYEMELKEEHGAQTVLNDRIKALSDERSDLTKARDRLLAEKQAVEMERDQLLARIEGDRDRVHEVGESGVGSLTAMIEELTEERDRLTRELHDADTRSTMLQNEVEVLKARQENAIPAARYRPDNPELLVSMVQELRTPMTSITGYIDLLLAESAGILGEMQRKFLQRVHTNVDRLDSMLEDLVQITELDTGQFKLAPAPVNVVGLIEDAITNASTQFREKGLAVNLAVEPEIPLVNGDKDAITQVIGQLLTNAYLVSPPDTEITILAGKREVSLDDGQVRSTDCVFVSVADRGGGIQPEDVDRVFARKYKAENPLIQGLGDTGVGMSIAKALVESHGGRLWLDVTEDVGTTFNFALPFESEAQSKES
jgi:signal transduction histidine kinase